ncbi:hypothetical protein EC991_009810 [Linnemannia zychae]|nr:hypothetical protein EC991_009810 [Linnemannia zychae]
MSFPPSFSRSQTPHTLRSSLGKDSSVNNNDISNLFQNLDNTHSDNEINKEDNDQDDDDEEKEQGREQSDTIIHLNKPSSPPTALPRFTFLSAPTAPSTTATPGDSFALLADKTSKRVRVTDPSATSESSSRRRNRSSSPYLLDNDADYTTATSSPSKRVRFDESRNQVHWHHRNSSISPPGSPAPAINLKAQPLVSALLRRSPYNQSPSSSFDFDESFTSVSSSSSSNAGNLSPEKFTLSLDNTSQEVMDFASSLTRLMGGSAANLGSQESDTSITSTSNSNHNSFSFNSPMLPSSASPRIFSSMFQASPPSPVRPSFMSYSPPPSSSLSSCWSPIMDDEDEDDSMATAPRMSPPPPPVLVQKKTRAPFVPRRPRNAGNLSPTRPGVAPAIPRRFPSMLKREASNASFLDNYPASLAPDADESDQLFPSPASRAALPSATAATPAATVPIIPRMSTPPREVSVSPVLPSLLASSANTTPIPASLPMLSSRAATISTTNTVPLLRKSISDIPLRSLSSTRRNEGNNLWLDTQKVVPKFKKSASFDELMDSPSSISKFLSQEDIIMTLAPLFPLQNSSSSSPAGSQPA